MFIKYNGYDLLELFCNEPRIINNEADIFSYTAEDAFGFKFCMYVSIYDRNVVLQLDHHNYTEPIFYLDLKDVEKLEGEKEKLLIYREKIAKPIVVYFKPNFQLGIDV